MGTEPVKKCPLLVMAGIIGICMPEGLTGLTAAGYNYDKCLLNECEWYDNGAEKCSVWLIQKELENMGQR